MNIRELMQDNILQYTNFHISNLIPGLKDAEGNKILEQEKLKGFSVENLMNSWIFTYIGHFNRNTKARTFFFTGC